MQRNLFLCGLILACSFVPISPFGGTRNLATLTQGTEVITLASNPGSYFGGSVASCDFDGDGTKDIIIGAYNDNSYAGSVTVIFGDSNFATVDMTNPAASGSGFRIRDSGRYYIGSKVVCVGNVNGDLFEDIGIVSAGGDRVVILYGSNLINSNVDLASLSYPAISRITRSGMTAIVDIVGIGDTTFDNRDDVVVVLQSSFVFSALVIYGTLGATLYVDVPNPGVSFIISNGAGQGAQMIIAPAGKFDSDNYYDFAIGNLNDGADVAIIFGQNGGYADMDFSATTYSLATPQKVLWVNGASSYRLGESMAYIGDLNSDNRGELLIGAPGIYSDFGAAFVIFSQPSFSADISILSFPDITIGYVITHGSVSGLNGGTSVFGCGPWDADCPVVVCDLMTTCNIILSFSVASTTGLFDMDAMKSEDGFAVYNSLLPYSYPMQVAYMGDANNDGYPEYLIGQGQLYSYDGRAFILFGLNKCTSPCKTCVGLVSADWTKCTSCEPGLGTDLKYNYACYATCPSHTYQDSGTSCATCNSNCLDCDVTSTYCTSCDPGSSLTWLYNNVCYASCPSHTFEDSATTCDTCDGNCLECDTTDTYCTSCDQGGVVPWLYNNVCVGSCPSHTYESSSTTCDDCDSNCLECATTDTYCISCDPGSSLTWLYLHVCYNACPSHSYQDSGTTCATCNTRCLDCSTTADNCDSCDNAGLYPLFYLNFCYSTCPSHSYQDSAVTCDQCDANCLNCVTTPTTCTSCDTAGLLPWLYNSACYSACPAEAPYTYSFVCYVQCPSGTAANSQKICLVIAPEISQAVKALNSVNDVRQISNEILSTISSLFFGGLHPIRSQSVQGPVSYYLFLNVDYPDNYGQYASSNFGSNQLANPFKNTGEVKTRHEGVHSANKYLKNQSLLANVGYSIMFLLICLLLIVLNDAMIAILQKQKKKDYEAKWYYRTLKRGSVLFRWSFLINQFIAKYEDLAFFSFLGIYNAGKGDDDTLNLIVCIFGFLITIAGLLGAFFIIKKLSKKLETLSEEEKEKEEYHNNDFLGRRLVLYKDLKKDKLMPLLYPFFLMLRVFGFSFVTIFLCNQTAIQLVFLNLYAVLMFIYLAKYRPLEEKDQLWITFAFEIDAFIALLGVTLLAIYNQADGSNEDTKTAFGYMIITANTGMLVLNFISFGLEIKEYMILAYGQLKNIYQKRKNKKKIAPEPNPSPLPSEIRGNERELRPSLEIVSSTIPERQGLFDELPVFLFSPSEAKLSPFSSYFENGSMNDKSGLSKLESAGLLQINSPNKRIPRGKQKKSDFFGEDVQESQLLKKE